jgi:hypothetical protein
MTKGDSLYTKLSQTMMAVALATAVVTSFGITPAKADNGREAHDNGNHYGRNKDRKRDKRDGKWDRNEKGKVRVITPVTPLDNRRRSRTTSQSYNNGRYYNNYPNNGYYNGGYYNNGRTYNSYPNSGYYNNGGYNNGGYNNGGYYDNRRGDLDSREVAERGAYYGYYDGFYRGQYDRNQGVRRPNPQGHGAYQFALNGWERDWGSANTFQQSYRQSFMRGYQEGYGRGTYRNQYKRRW